MLFNCLFPSPTHPPNACSMRKGTLFTDQMQIICHQILSVWYFEKITCNNCLCCSSEVSPRFWPVAVGHNYRELQILLRTDLI